MKTALLIVVLAMLVVACGGHPDTVNTVTQIQRSDHGGESNLWLMTVDLPDGRVLECVGYWGDQIVDCDWPDR